MKPLGLTRYIEKPRVETREPAKAVMESASGLEPRIGLRA
jgi:K+-transporting ATPase c subunit